MSTHTPGPWTLQPIGDETECNILGARRELVATVSDNDARLIAAAPEMLALLREFAEMLPDATLAAIGSTGLKTDAIRRARAVLARIDGTRDERPVRLIQHGLAGEWDCIGPEGERVAGPFPTHAAALAWATRRGAR